MQPMVIDRRSLLVSGAGVLATTLMGRLDAAAAHEKRERLFAAARKSRGGNYSAAIFRPDGRDANAVTLPGRGHDLTGCPVTGTCVAFARRPGSFAVAFRPDPSWQPVRFTTPPDRHFYGHGVFSRDGRLLYATENDFDAGAGRIGVYDATAAFQRIGEFASHGVGPHDLALMADGRTLVIANGGIETHPDIGGGRTKLNLATMSPSLAYLNSETGDLIERHELPASLRKLSLRHLDVGAGRTVVIGGQLEGNVTADAPLVLRHRLGQEPESVDLDPTISLRLRGYISSVAIDASGEIAALTASRGSTVLFLDVGSGRILGTQPLADVSGVAPASSGFLLTTGLGEVRDEFGPEGGSSVSRTGWHWDNHAMALLVQGQIGSSPVSRKT